MENIKKKAPTSSIKNVVPIIKTKNVFTLSQNLKSRISPAISFVAMLRFRNNEIKKKESVIIPNPPICIRHKIMHFPKTVK